MMQMTGADLIVKLLERQGIRTIAGVPGGAALPMYDALSKSEQIHHVLCRHEQGAGFIAQGMARVSGRPEVCLASSGPGATNLVTAIADAKLDSIPMIALTGQVPLSMIGTDAFQEVDIYGITVPITKHNFLVRSAQELLTVVPEAFRIAGLAAKGRLDMAPDRAVRLACRDAFRKTGLLSRIIPAIDEVLSAGDLPRPEPPPEAMPVAIPEATSGDAGHRG